MNSYTILVVAALTGLSAACSDPAEGPAVDSDARRGMAFSVEAISPAAGTPLGGTTVTIGGSGFDESANMVLFGDVVATEVSFVDETTITVTTPPGVSGPVDVTVFGASGYGTLGSGYEYFPGPTVQEVSPDTIKPGATVTLTGSGFQDNEVTTPDIAVGAGGCGDVQVLSDSELTCVASEPGPSFESQLVTLSNENGSASHDGLRFAAQGLIVVDRAGTITYVDPEAAAPTAFTVGTLSEGLHSIVSDGNGGFFVRPQNNRQNLLRFDIDTASLSLVGAIGQDYTDLAMANGQLLGLRRQISPTDPARYLLIDQADASTTLGQVNDLTIDPVRKAMAFAGGNDVLLAGRSNAPIYLLNILTGDSTELVPAAEQTHDIRSLTTYKGQIYGIARGFLLPPPPGKGGGGISRLIHLDTTTGVITDIATLPGDAHGIAGLEN